MKPCTRHNVLPSPSSFRSSVKQACRSTDFHAHLLAIVVTSSILLLFAWLLLRMPTPTSAPPHAPSTMRVTLVAREPVPNLEKPVQEPERVSTKRRVPIAPVIEPHTAPVAVTRAGRVPSTSDNPQAQLYTRDGRVRMGQVVDALDPGYAAVPPGLTDARALDKARKLLDRPNPVNYRETRFEKDWKSDGTLGDVAVQSINRGMKRVNGLIWGKDVESVKARPPPEVRFNPALADNRADLGREATGDAYKAAPIAHEVVPDLKGGASRRIREELAVVERLQTVCDAARRTQLLSTARTHLTDLERVEHALAHGADPVMAEQMLPRQADSAYDLARRALWYARRELGACVSAR